jgi:hypothetical protein
MPRLATSPATGRASSTSPNAPAQQGADLLLTPELALCGYPPEDLLLRDDFCAACERELDTLASQPAPMASPSSSATPRNAASAATTQRR